MNLFGARGRARHHLSVMGSIYSGSAMSHRTFRSPTQLLMLKQTQQDNETGNMSPFSVWTNNHCRQHFQVSW